MGRPRSLRKDVGRFAKFFVKPTKHEKALRRQAKKQARVMRKIARRKTEKPSREFAKFIAEERRRRRIEGI